MTIVCATHFTDSSLSAVRAAGELARKHRQPLWLVTVLPSYGQDSKEEKFQAANRALQLEAAALAAADVEINTAVVNGPIGRAVGQFCTEKKASLLVVGDTSHRISAVLAGTLDKFAYGIEIPLLVVRDPRPFEAWARGTVPLKVMLALDHTWSSAVARDWIGRLAEYGPIDLVAAHIWWPKEEYDRRGLPRPAADATDLEISALLRSETEGALHALPGNVRHRVNLEIGLGHIGEQLLAMAEREQVDVVVLGTHPHHGPLAQVRLVSHDVLANAPMSVATVPGPEVHARAVGESHPSAPVGHR